MEDSNNNNNGYKVVLLGESEVGKDEIISSITNTSFFDQNSINSQSSHFIINTLCFPDGKFVNLEIWNTAGQEKFRPLAKIYYKDAKVVILIYDITSKKSFTELKQYLYEQVKLYGRKDVIFAICANKMEYYQSLQVTEQEGKEFAKSIGAGFFCTSSLSNAGIDNMLENIGKKLLDPNYDFYEDENKIKEEYERKKKERMYLEEKLKKEKNKKNMENKKNKCIIY